jgi:RNA polymerase sigma-54 factor
MEQRQLLTPRMIQSMEILQLPLMALEERIEQELVSNPVLELREPEGLGKEGADEGASPEVTGDSDNYSEGEQMLVVKDQEDISPAEFDRLEKLSDYLENEEFSTNSNYQRTQSIGGEEGDRKLEAMANTASRGTNLSEHLLDQWRFIEAPDKIKRAGDAIINFIDSEGYLRTPLETVRIETKEPFTIDELQQALNLVQKLDPAGVGATNLRECLLLQLDALEEDDEAWDTHDFDLERTLITDHLKDLELNRYPQISKKLARPIEELKAAVKRMSRLVPHPGKQISQEDAPPIMPDAIVYFDEDTGKFEIEMTRDPAPNLYVAGTWRKFLKAKKGDKSTREFISNNVRNAKWLIEAIEQRRNTIYRVIRVVVDAQKDFFDKGPEFLKPLPMIQVADQLGIHVATVSRAVSEKWIQTPRGLFPLRRFFSGGTTNAEGEDMSWDAVKEKLKVIIDNEDTKNPLNDDEIVEKLKEQGIDLARRTVAKYRKIMNIPTARQRRQF